MAIVSNTYQCLVCGETSYIDVDGSVKTCQSCGNNESTKFSAL